MSTHPGLHRTFLILALKIPSPRKLLDPRQTRTEVKRTSIPPLQLIGAYYEVESIATPFQPSNGCMEASGGDSLL